MTLDDALHDLAAISNELPRAAMQWVLDHWSEAGPRFVALLDAYTRGEDRSEQTERALFLVIHLLGERAETAAFGPLCRLLLDAETSNLILGDAITETLLRIMVSTYDGDVAALTTVIEATGADDFVREGALLVMAYLARTGRLPEGEMRAHLLRWLADLRPQAKHIVWVGWVTAVAHLGYTDLTDAVETLIQRGFVPGDVMGVADFEHDLERTLDDPERMAGFAHDRIGPAKSAIEELESWYASAGRGEDELELPDYEVQQPITNPLRGVGRNDPCPCGSGKKFKKCCLT